MNEEKHFDKGKNIHKQVKITNRDDSSYVGHKADAPC